MPGYEAGAIKRNMKHNSTLSTVISIDLPTRSMLPLLPVDQCIDISLMSRGVIHVWTSGNRAAESIYR